jgi:biotin carboxyl carrier protein
LTRQVVVDGRAAQLRLEGSQVELRTEDGQTIRQSEVARLGAGLYLVTLDGRSYRVAVGGGPEAMVNGRLVRAEVYDPRDLRSGTGRGLRGARSEVAAPMPGKVIRVLVAPGDAVQEGQGLIVVEAMKMQNEMKSPQAGRVAQVRASAGATVGAGEVLVVIE